MSGAEEQKLQAVKRSLAISQKVVSAAILDAKRRKKSAGVKRRKVHRSASVSLAGGKRRRKGCGKKKHCKK